MPRASDWLMCASVHRYFPRLVSLWHIGIGFVTKNFTDWNMMMSAETGAKKTKSTDLTTRTGFIFQVRPSRPSDEAALAKFFSQISAADMRFRFLTAIKEVGHDRLVTMTTTDHHRTENFLAFIDDEAEIIATAMLACDEKLEIGEIATAILPEFKHKGVSWDMLAYVVRYAEEIGVKSIVSIESRDHHEAIAMEKEMGFTSESYPGDATLVLLKRVLKSK